VAAAGRVPGKWVARPVTVAAPAPAALSAPAAGPAAVTAATPVPAAARVALNFVARPVTVAPPTPAATAAEELVAPAGVCTHAWVPVQVSAPSHLVVAMVRFVVFVFVCSVDTLL
jgi:hypothetical protein